jgi:hypothetical protein
MKHVYTAYTRMVNKDTFYFVKKYSVFPEYQDFPKVLDSMGMHVDFYRACSIAEIYDEAIVNQLLNELHILPETAKVIPMSGIKSITHSLIKNTHHAILKLRLASIN